MAISERIRFIRKKRGITCKELGQRIGFPDHSADVRISQYESGSRTPKREILEKIASVLEVSPEALSVPGLDGEAEALFSLFAMEDIYGFKICRSGSHLYLILGDTGASNGQLQEMLLKWSCYAELLNTGKISKQEYDQWRYSFSSDSKENQKKHRHTGSQKNKRP